MGMEMSSFESRFALKDGLYSEHEKHFYELSAIL